MSDYGFYIVTVNPDSPFPYETFYFWKKSDLATLKNLASMAFTRHVQDEIDMGAELASGATDVAGKITTRQIDEGQAFMHGAALNALKSL